MHLLVDTSVWSLYLRRKDRDENDSFVRRLDWHLDEMDTIHLVGPVLQELLSGIREPTQYDRLRELLEFFPLLELERTDFEEAAKLSNLCRKKGIQASTTDFLIAHAGASRNYPLLTADRDFVQIARHCDLMLLNPL